MRVRDPAQWDLAPKAAVAVQREFARRVVREDRVRRLRTIAGVDAGFPAGGALTRAAVVVMSYPDLDVVEESVVELPTRFPYVPGLLSFREVPAILEALSAIERRPDLILCDGHGIAHPRVFGSACHLGLATGIATVGVGKSCLYGDYAEPGSARGSRSPLEARGEEIGAVLRTRAAVRPLIVSIGHRVSLDRAVDVVLSCAPRFRLPEPIRAADRLASRRP